MVSCHWLSNYEMHLHQHRWGNPDLVWLILLSGISCFDKLTSSVTRFLSVPFDMHILQHRLAAIHRQLSAKFDSLIAVRVLQIATPGTPAVANHVIDLGNIFCAHRRLGQSHQLGCYVFIITHGISYILIYPLIVTNVMNHGGKTTRRWGWKWWRKFVLPHTCRLRYRNILWLLIQKTLDMYSARWD